MNLSFKDLRFIIEAIEHQINVYQERLQVIEDVDEDEAAELGNDIKFLELLHADMTTSLEQNTSVKSLSSDDTFSPVWKDNYSEVSQDLSFQELVQLTLKLSLSERLFLVEAITASVRQEVTIGQ
ncbi:hypothetical protein IQ270_20995 [Microcoleus sp. LEGE 07076]|uniref:hypothetical protein n=1 Tax=Microcoleus sp. LEGE 07076 TaxID=915322 RepID=UPI001880833E|nr:hypothetical protein [Microcoleus sp. LEGE 07076]MBE9187065.1 hypothetical protein [Microcoleus sp. LEGE 07076]